MPILREALSHSPTFTPAQLQIMREAFDAGSQELGIVEGNPEDRIRFAELVLSLMSATPVNGAPELTPESLREEAVAWFRAPR